MESAIPLGMEFKLSTSLVLALLTTLLGFTNLATAANSNGSVQCRLVVKNSTNKRIGVLFSMVSGPALLAITETNFGVGHMDIISMIEQQTPKLGKIKGTLWMGEVGFFGRQNEGFFIQEAREISGSFIRYKQDLEDKGFKVENSNRYLMAFLDTAGIPRSKQFENFRPYYENQPHLNPAVDALKTLLNLENTTHDLRNYFNPVFQDLKNAYLLSQQPHARKLPAMQKNIDRMDRIFQRHIEALHWMQNLNHFPQIDALIYGLQRIISGDATPREVQMTQQLQQQQFDALFSPPNARDLIIIQGKR